MGVPVAQGPGEVVALDGPATLAACRLAIPGDFSSAAFFLVAGLLGARDGLVIRNVGVNPTRTGLLTLLRKMGGRIELQAQRHNGSEPVADIHVMQSELQGIDVPPELVPLAIDEFPVLFVAAACARGQTRGDGCGGVAAQGKRSPGCHGGGASNAGRGSGAGAGGLEIQGGRLQGGCIDSHGDHRIAMAFTVASLAASETIEILRTDEVATSFPDFIQTATHSGLKLDARPSNSEGKG